MAALAKCSTSDCLEVAEKRCARCETTYCSIACQTKDWPAHKPACKRFAAAASAAAAAAAAAASAAAATATAATAQPHPEASLTQTLCNKPVYMQSAKVPSARLVAALGGELSTPLPPGAGPAALALRAGQSDLLSLAGHDTCSVVRVVRIGYVSEAFAPGEVGQAQELIAARDLGLREARARGDAGAPPPHDDIDCAVRRVTFVQDFGVFGWLVQRGVIVKWDVGMLGLLPSSQDARSTAEVAASLILGPNGV